MNKNSTPFVRMETDFSLFFIIFSKFNLTSPTSIPRFCNFFAFWKFSDKFSKLFEGIHPTLRQVPPSVFRASTHAVLKPNWDNLIAHT